MKKVEFASKEKDVALTTMASEDEVIAPPYEDESQEIDYDLVSSGPLYFDKRNLAPGYVPCFVSNKPGEIEMYKRWGLSSCYR